MIVKETTELVRLLKLQSAEKVREQVIFKSFLTLSNNITCSADNKMWRDKLGSAEVKQHAVWTVP